MGDPKAGWKRVKLGEVVQQVKDKVDPLTAGLDRIVRGEHMDTDDLRIRRWEEFGDNYLGPAFHMRFRPGHVLYGSRRTYLRKVALADFEGITANTTYVVESRDSTRLLPELLPYILSTESFHEHSIKQSKGSVNPYVNFSDLAWYEFDLPPKPEQERLVGLLSSAAGVVEAYREALEAARSASTAMLHRLMSVGLESTAREPSRKTGDAILPDGWTTPALSEVATVQRGRFSHRPRNLPEFFGGPYPFAQTGDVGSARGRDFAPSQYLSDEGVKYSRSFPPGSILITIAAVIGATAITTTETWCPDSVVGIEPSDRVRVDFLEYALRYRRPYLEYEIATQTAQKNINLNALRPLRVPVPPLDVQDEIVEVLRGTDEAVAAVEQRLRDAEQLLATLLNRALGGAL